jgi:hypothetical protein
MKALITSALVVATLGGSALAGDAQLGNLAGVDPASYSNAEMIRIIDARRDNDTQALNFLLSGGNRASVGTEVTAGSEQLARLAGVSAGEYTPAELTAILRAREDGDSAALAFYLSHGNRNDLGSTVQVTAGRAQMATLAGLDASTASLAELTRNQPD